MRLERWCRSRESQPVFGGPNVAKYSNFGSLDLAKHLQHSSKPEVLILVRNEGAARARGEYGQPRKSTERVGRSFDCRDFTKITQLPKRRLECRIGRQLYIVETTFSVC